MRLIPVLRFLFIFFPIWFISSCDALSIDDIKNSFGNHPCIPGSLTSLENHKGPEILLTETPASYSKIDNVLPATIAEEDKSVLSRINELAEYNEIKYLYELENEAGPDHKKVFTVKLVLGDEQYVGTGTSLKNAQTQAADLALERTEYEFPLPKEKETKSLTPTVLLSNFAAQVGFVVDYLLLTNEIEVSLNSDLPPDKLRKSYLQKLNESIYANSSLRYRKDETDLKGPFKVKVTFDGQSFIGTDNTVQGAKHQAAKKALKHAAKLVEKGQLDCINENSRECRERRESIKSPVSQIIEAAQKRNLQATFEIIKEYGPDHKKSFVTQCKVGDFTTTGEGRSKKESKRIAAQSMLENIPFFPESNAESVIGSFVGKKQSKKSKRKNKVIKNNFEKFALMLDNVLEYGSNILTPSDSDIKPGKQTKSTKPKQGHNLKSSQDDLISITNTLNLEIDFYDVDGTDNKFYSILTLHTKPSYICFGEGTSQKKSRDKAAKGGINFIYKSGLFDKIYFKDKIETEQDELQEESKVWIPFIEETE